jgi:hypothetical protein
MVRKKAPAKRAGRGEAKKSAPRLGAVAAEWLAKLPPVVKGASCYALELSIGPGSARRAETFVYNRKEHIRYCLEFEFNGPDPAAAAGFALEYGETIVIWVIRKGRLELAVDLHPFIFARLEGKWAGPKFAKVPGLHGLLADGREIPLPPADAPYESMDFGIAEESIRFRVDWPEIDRRLPALPPPLLRPGQSMNFLPNRDVARPFDSCICEKRRLLHGVDYGHRDHEDIGGGLMVGFVDPDPG